LGIPLVLKDFDSLTHPGGDFLKMPPEPGEEGFERSRVHANSKGVNKEGAGCLDFDFDMEGKGRLLIRPSSIP